MAKKTTETAATPPAADAPTAGTRPLVRSGAAMPVGSRVQQEAAWLALRRYRRQIGSMPVAMREFIVLSLMADVEEDHKQAAAPRGAEAGSAPANPASTFQNQAVDENQAL